MSAVAIGNDPRNGVWEPESDDAARACELDVGHRVASATVTVPSRAVPRAALVGGGVIATLAVVGVAVAIASSGGEDEGKAVKSPIEPTTLTVAQQIKRGSPSTVELSTRGPGFSRGRKTTLSGGGYMRSGVSTPRRSRAASSWRRVVAASARREARVALSPAASTGQAA